MDVQLIATSALELPSSQRVDAIVHDGTTDLRTWPGPGPDRDLVEHYGAELSSVLERERDRLEGGELPIGSMLRLHRGKLHCDFLLWIATRPPETAGVQAPAPAKTILHTAVKDALAFVSERHVRRVAFRPLGAGPNAMADVDRLVLIARAANEFHDERYAAGRPTCVEQVLVCHAHTSKISEARRALGRAVKMAELPAPPPPSRGADAAKRTRTATASAPRKGAPRRSARPTLSPDEIARARASAGAYDRAHTYSVGDLFVHPKFGAGRVEQLTPEGFILVIFEDGETKRLLHARP